MNSSNPRIQEEPAHFNVQSVKEFGLSQTSQASPARTQFEASLVILRRININKLTLLRVTGHILQNNRSHLQLIIYF